MKTTEKMLLKRGVGGRGGTRRDTWPGRGDRAETRRSKGNGGSIVPRLKGISIGAIEI